jgi:hypothetical protein
MKVIGLFKIADRKMRGGERENRGMEDKIDLHCFSSALLFSPSPLH